MLKSIIIAATLAIGITASHASTCDERKAAVDARIMPFAHASLDVRWIDEQVKLGKVPPLQETFSKLSTLFIESTGMLAVLKVYIPECKPDQASAITYLQDRIDEMSSILDTMRVKLKEGS